MKPILNIAFCTAIAQERLVSSYGAVFKNTHQKRRRVIRPNVFFWYLLLIIQMFSFSMRIKRRKKDAVLITASFQANTYSIQNILKCARSCTIYIITLFVLLWNSKYHNIILWQAEFKPACKFHHVHILKFEQVICIMRINCSVRTNKTIHIAFNFF